MEETESWVCQNSDLKTLLLLFQDQGIEEASFWTGTKTRKRDA